MIGIDYIRFMYMFAQLMFVLFKQHIFDNYLEGTGYTLGNAVDTLNYSMGSVMYVRFRSDANMFALAQTQEI